MTYIGDAQAEGAIFLPAIQPTYAKVPFRAQKSIAGRPWPEKLRLKDLNFLNPSSRLFSIKYALASAGLFAKERGANMVTERDRKKTVIIGDSGGYQIIGGTLDHRTADVRNKMLRWLEDNCDWAMTLDVPTKGIKNGTSGYEHFDECLSDTLSYLDFFASERRAGMTQFLNVLQGRSKKETDDWYRAVKDYPFEGWAFAGDTKANFYATIRRLLIMQEDGLLAGKDWIHFLGIATLPFAMVLTHLQTALRRHVNPKVILSYDVSSPFLMTRYRQGYTQASFDYTSFGLKGAEMPDSKRYLGSEIPFPFSSPLGDRLSWGHLCITDEAVQNSSYDALSYNLLQNHNVYIHTKAIIDANRIGRLQAAEASRWCDHLVFKARDAIDAVFAADDPMKALERHKPVLQKVCGSRTAQSAWDIEDDAR